MSVAKKYLRDVKIVDAVAGTELRESIFFAQRVIKSFKGVPKHEMKTSILVLIKMKSFDGREEFYLCLTHVLISFFNKTHDIMEIREHDESSDESTTTNSVQSAKA